MIKLFHFYLIPFTFHFFNWFEGYLVHFNNNLIQDSKDFNEPLFLTPLIKAGKIDEAKNKSKVIGLPNAPEVKSYSGYLTVNEKFNSNMFFWFFPSKVCFHFLNTLKAENNFYY